MMIICMYKRIISYIKNNKDKIYKKKFMRENRGINIVFNKIFKKVKVG